jgi:protein-S-isoprenylcysteine O-methyltransferase Ste14
MTYTKNLSDTLYRGRVFLLAALFVAAMTENSLHPFPLWSYALTFLPANPEGLSSAGERRIILLFPLILYTCSLFVRLSATATLGPKTVWSLSAKTEKLIKKDLFFHLRHPLYAGSAGMIFSLSVMSSVKGALILSGLGVPLLIFLSRYEENRILIVYPEYKSYMLETPGFCPKTHSFKSILGDSFRPLKENLGFALRSEAANVALLAGFCSFWIKPDLTLFWIFFSIGLLLALTAPQWLHAGTSSEKS